MASNSLDITEEGPSIFQTPSPNAKSPFLLMTMLFPRVTHPVALVLHPRLLLKTQGDSLDSHKTQAIFFCAPATTTLEGGALAQPFLETGALARRRSCVSLQSEIEMVPWVSWQLMPTHPQVPPRVFPSGKVGTACCCLALKCRPR